MAKGLGKGIDALFPDIDINEKEAVEEILIKECRPNPYQPRKVFHSNKIEELKESILQHGILQPIIVRNIKNGYEIVVGERRFRAAKEAGLTSIPAVVKEFSDENMMELALLENLQREDLTPIEEAHAYSNLMTELKITQEELAKRLGKSRPYIANIVRLLSLPKPISNLINKGELSMGHGKALLGLKNKEKLIPLVNKIKEEKLNVRQLEQMIIKLNENTMQKNKKEKQKKDVFIIESENQLSNYLGTGVNIRQGKRKGKIEIDFFSEEDLDRILKLFHA